jgi:hypothetical protein
MFSLEQPFEELVEAQVLACGLVGDHGQVRCHCPEAKSITEVFDPLEFDH